MTLPLTALLLGRDLAAMVVFGMLLRRKKGLRAAVICLCTALAVALAVHIANLLLEDIWPVLGPAPGNSITKPPACYGL